MLAQQLEADAKRLFAAQAVFACSVADARVHHYQFICSVDYANSIRAHDPRSRDIDAGKASQDKEIQMIQSRCKNSNAELSGTRLGDRQVVADFQLFEATVAGDG